MLYPWTPRSHPRVSFVWSFCYWVFLRYSLWKIDVAIISNITYYICVVTGTISFSKVKRSWTKLITYQWIFRNGSEWKSFVMGNPFLIEFMHLLSFLGLKPEAFCKVNLVSLSLWWKRSFIEQILTFTVAQPSRAYGSWLFMKKEHIQASTS